MTSTVFSSQLGHTALLSLLLDQIILNLSVLMTCCKTVDYSRLDTVKDYNITGGIIGFVPTSAAATGPCFNLINRGRLKSDLRLIREWEIVGAVLDLVRLNTNIDSPKVAGKRPSVYIIPF